jgi:hypothetical protein
MIINGKGPERDREDRLIDKPKILGSVMGV